MQEAPPPAPAMLDDDDTRLESLGYRPQLNRVLGLFANFSVAFTYLSPMVGIFTLFTLGLSTGGPAYIWLTFIPVAGMLLVALVFGELASHYPVAGALYQYSKYTVGRRFGWFVGWFYGIALLVTVAAVDTGVVAYAVALGHDLFHWSFNASSHGTILVVTLGLLAIQTTLNTIGAKIMGRVAQIGVYVEILGTFGIAIVLAIHGFHHGLGFLTTTQNVQHVQSNPLGLDFGGSWIAAALVAVLAPVYIFYGFESAGDISEETKNAGRQVPRAMRLALIWGGIASFVLTGALLLAMPAGANSVVKTIQGGGIPYILEQPAERPAGDDAGPDHPRVLLLRQRGAGRRQQARLLLRPGRRAARLQVDLRGERAVQDPGQRAVRRRADHRGVRGLRVRLAHPRRQDLVLHLPGQHERAGVAGVLRDQRHLPVVPADGDRVDDRPAPRLGARPAGSSWAAGPGRCRWPPSCTWA